MVLDLQHGRGFDKEQAWLLSSFAK